MDYIVPFDISTITKEEKDLDVDSNSYRYSTFHLKINEKFLVLDIKGVAAFHITGGSSVTIYPYREADPDDIHFFLNGPVVGAVLHQQGFLPFHACSFLYKNRGIAICGRSGVGKSSVTAAFCQQGGVYISDDITSVKVSPQGTTILPASRPLKLWDDSLRKLNLKSDGLKRARSCLDKFYIEGTGQLASEQRLDYLFILSTHNKNEFATKELWGIEKYNALRSQIYRKIYLKGMPDIEKKYFRELLLLAGKVKVINISRPQICDIYKVVKVIESEIYQ